MARGKAALLDMFISLSHGKREGCAVGHVHFSFAWPKEKQNQRERPPAASPRLKIESFPLKRANALRFAPVERARFFTGKCSDFLHASPKRPELYPIIRRNRSFI
jgi:hypothetical protein